MKKPQIAETKVTYRDWQGKCLSKIYDKIQAAHQLNFGEQCMIEVDEEIYMNQLECVPPIYHESRAQVSDILQMVVNGYFNGYGLTTTPESIIAQSFQVGEPMATVRNRPVYATYVDVEGRFYYVGCMFEQTGK